MAKLVIHTKNGNSIEAPFEAWCVAIINSVPAAIQQEIFLRVARLDGASIIPDKFTVFEDQLGTMQIVENPTIDLGKRMLG